MGREFISTGNVNIALPMNTVVWTNQEAAAVNEFFQQPTAVSYNELDVKVQTISKGLQESATARKTGENLTRLYFADNQPSSQAHVIGNVLQHPETVRTLLETSEAGQNALINYLGSENASKLIGISYEHQHDDAARSEALYQWGHQMVANRPTSDPDYIVQNQAQEESELNNSNLGVDTTPLNNLLLQPQAQLRPAQQSQTDGLHSTDTESHLTALENLLLAPSLNVSGISNQFVNLTSMQANLLEYVALRSAPHHER